MESVDLNRGFTFFPSAFALIFALIFASFLFSCVKSSHSKGALGSSLLMRVLHVHGPRAMPQMLRIHASRIVACVTNLSALWNRSFKLFEDKTMSQGTSAMTILHPRDLSVTFVILFAGIIPASCFKIDFNSEEYSLPWKQRFDNT